MIKSALVFAMALCIAPPALAQNHTYKILATSKTSTLQKELQEAADRN